MPVKLTLTCAQCGAPLPPVAEPRGTLVCGHCGSTLYYALTPSEFALFTQGIRAEQEQEGAFTVSGLERVLAEGLSALKEQVDRSTRYNAMLARPLVEQTLYDERTKLAALTAELDAKKRVIKKKRSDWRQLMLGVYGIGGVIGLACLAGDSLQWALTAVAVLAAVVLYDVWQMGLIDAEEARLIKAATPAIDKLIAAIGESEATLAEMRPTSLHHSW